MDYETFFKTVTGGKHTPYGWQGRLANGDGYEADNPSTHTGTPCQSRLIDIPTGLGKTAGVVLAWLWNRRRDGTDPQASHSTTPPLHHSTTQPLHHSTTQPLHHSTTPPLNHSPAWPRRLVYCLPMRTLVEQTAREVENWLINLWQNADELNLSPEALDEVRWLIGAPPDATPSFFIPQPSSFKSPIILMGGEDLTPAKRDWDLYPEKPAILIGTQDMLLSRALNRGYGMSRYRWPIHFGLLNNDALWVIDEVQLMGAGAAPNGPCRSTNPDLRNRRKEKSPIVLLWRQGGQQSQFPAPDQLQSTACRFHAPSANPRTATASCLPSLRPSPRPNCRLHKNAPPAASAARHRGWTDHPKAYRLHPGDLHS